MDYVDWTIAIGGALVGHEVLFQLWNLILTN